MIKFSHTIFALPFALTSAALAFTQYPFSWSKVGWIVMAMVGARSAAMGFNRIIDAQWDGLNPRTSQRELPQGVISKASAVAFVVVSALILIIASYGLNVLCFVLSPVALIVIFFYSFTKRFTTLAHLFLGLALALAPVGSWLAIAGEWSAVSILLGLAVMTWVAGFDIIYACQDVDFDRRTGLFSIPQKYGVAIALQISRSLHVVTVGLLTVVGVLFAMGAVYFCGTAMVAGVLIYEHRLVKADDLSRVNLAFFNLNGLVSVLFFLTTTADVWMLGLFLT